ncbi:MAG: bifunctional glutamate N-acetyltransferase/amino-acid acetyltransferase ArgJ [Porticoccaceae bacterium]|nr:bifunctional glutamate N-acetyltransferase/amino-acid acetyltransferase ArgJ [Porticoccaceae bacterium]
MAVGKDTFPTLHPVAGFRLGTGSAGIKKPGKKDLVIMAFNRDASIAACFTQNAFCAAPVQLAKQHLHRGTPQYLVTNTGNANAGTGKPGLENAARVCEALAAIANCKSEDVLPYSTGVIGEPLPVEKIIAALGATLENCREDGWRDAGIGIMTTDTRPKGASVQVAIDGRLVTLTGISKGAGMIKPNMATMLGYVATDAQVDQALLQKMLSLSVERSFNRITVDGDTSTNDAVTLVATGKSAVPITPANEALFQQALDGVLIELAQAIIRDGEGATKFVTVAVTGAATKEECLKVAYAVAESPLVKTALFASDPNWGRILAAIGRAGVDSLDVDKISVKLGDVLIAENGGRAASYTEAAGQAVMNQEEIVISINLGRGSISETVWTTDFSHEYVTINAEYRT